MLHGAGMDPIDVGERGPLLGDRGDVFHLHRIGGEPVGAALREHPRHVGPHHAADDLFGVGGDLLHRAAAVAEGGALAVGLAIGDALAWVSVKAIEDGVDISAVAEGMEMMGAASVLYPKLFLKDVVLANVVVLILGFFASLSPAWRASRYEPVEAITKV